MHINIRANLIALLVFIPLGMLATALLSYYDEGTYRAFRSFPDFLFQGGVHTSDLWMWTMMFVLLWLGIFNYQLRYEGLEKKIGRRILIAVTLSPAIAFIFIFTLFGLIKLIHFALG